MELSCVVHDRKYLSKFHATINELRRIGEFQISTLQQLPKRCCSCHGQKGQLKLSDQIVEHIFIYLGERSFDIDQLRRFCQDIEQPQEIKPVTLDSIELEHYIVLQSPPSSSVLDHQKRIGRFVGADGKHLLKLERKLNASVHIINDKSSKGLQKSARDLRERHCKNQRSTVLVVFIIKNNDYNPANIEQIKQSLADRWHNLDVTVNVRQRPRVQRSAYTIRPSIPIGGDTRWRPKKRIPKTKQKLLDKQQAEEEKALSQSSIKSLATLRQTTKSNKSKK